MWYEEYLAGWSQENVKLGSEYAGKMIGTGHPLLYRAAAKVFVRKYWQVLS